MLGAGQSAFQVTHAEVTVCTAQLFTLKTCYESVQAPGESAFEKRICVDSCLEYLV